MVTDRLPRTRYEMSPVVKGLDRLVRDQLPIVAVLLVAYAALSVVLPALGLVVRGVEASYETVSASQECSVQLLEALQDKGVVIGCDRLKRAKTDELISDSDYFDMPLKIAGLFLAAAVVVGVIIGLLRVLLVRINAVGRARFRAEIAAANEAVKSTFFYVDRLKVVRPQGQNPLVEVTAWPLDNFEMPPLAVTLRLADCRWQLSDGPALVLFPEAYYSTVNGQLASGTQLVLCSSVRPSGMPVYEVATDELNRRILAIQSLLVGDVPVLGG